MARSPVAIAILRTLPDIQCSLKAREWAIPAVSL